MKSFYSFFEQAEDTANEPAKRLSDTLVTTYGRHNPPHKGHGLVFNKATDIAGNEGGDERYYTSASQDRKKNPLPRDMKHDFLKKMWPQHAKKWDTDPEVNTFLKSLAKGHKDGYKKVHFVGGGDRRQDMENLARKYNGDLYDFDEITAHSAGERGDDIISASKQRKHAENDDYESFAEGLPSIKGFDPKELFKAVQMFGMKNEEYTPDELHNLYAEGQLFKVGDIVESQTTGLIGQIHRCGANHLIVVTDDGIMFKSFIQDVQAI